MWQVQNAQIMNKEVVEDILAIRIKKLKSEISRSLNSYSLEATIQGGKALQKGTAQ